MSKAQEEHAAGWIGMLKGTGYAITSETLDSIAKSTGVDRDVIEQLAASAATIPDKRTPQMLEDARADERLRQDARFRREHRSEWREQNHEED